MSEHVKFKVTIPTNWIVAVPLKTYQRFSDRVSVYPDIWRGQEPLLDGYRVEGTAPREIVTLLMAAAQGHDVKSILDALDERDVLAGD